MKNKKLFVGILAVVFTFIVAVSLYFVLREKKSSDYGKVTIVVEIDENHKTTKEISYSEGDTLLKIVQDTFENVTYKDGMIMTILDYETPSDWSTFLMIYINDVESTEGIKDIELVNGYKYSFVVTTFNYN